MGKIMETRQWRFIKKMFLKRLEMLETHEFGKESTRSR